MNNEYIKGKFIKVKKVTSPEGAELELNERRHSACGLVFNNDFTKILLVKQWRVGAQDYIYELPAGMVDKGEEPKIAFVREVMEETGYAVNSNVHYIGNYYNSPGVSSEKAHLFISYVQNSDELPLEQNLDENEYLTFEWHSFEDAENLLEGLASRVLLLEYKSNKEKYQKEKLRIGIYGGAFSPLHNMHLRTVEESIEQFNLNKVVIVPVGDNYKKDNLLPFETRKELLKQSFSYNDKVEISDIDNEELNSLTSYETCNRIYEKYGLFYDVDIYYIMGADNFKDIYKWNQGISLINKYKIIIVSRKDVEILIDNYDWMKGNLIKLELLIENNISSSAIRNLYKNNKSIAGLVPRAIEDYILNGGKL